MSRMCQSLDLFFFSCFFLTAQSQTGKILPPKDVSLRWRSDLEPEWSWAPHSGVNCTYEVNLVNAQGGLRNVSNLTTPVWSALHVMDGGFLNFSVRTVCNGHRGEAAFVLTKYPELVKNLECYLTSYTEAHCSWKAAPHTQHVRLYYRYPRPLSNNESVSQQLKECLMYTTTKDMRTVCDVQPDELHEIQFVINGTVNNELVRNTFRKDLYADVRLPPLEWNVTKTDGKFDITWIPPYFGDRDFWTFVINYTECGEEKKKDVKQSPAQLDAVPHCAYRMTIKAVCDKLVCKRGESPWSEEKYFDAETDRRALLYAAVIIPLLFAGLAIVAFVCCRKNKEKVFPKVPQPRDLLSDISDNNNKITVCNLYIPAREEENCKISLVIDPQISKPNW